MTFNRFDSAGFMLHLCARLNEKRMRERLKPLGMTTAYLPIYFTLQAVGASTQTELAERAMIEQPTMAMTLRRMERDGLIQREEDEADRRRSIISLTRHALDLAPMVEAAANEVNLVTLEGLTTEEHATLMRLCMKIADNLADQYIHPEQIGSAMRKSD